MDSIQLTELIKGRAYELGFSLVGVCDTEPLLDEGNKLKSWISFGYQYKLKWIEDSITVRTNPKELLPNAKSIIVLGINFYNKVEYREEKNIGKISRHAIIKDYHTVIKEKLEALSNYIKTLIPNSNLKYFCDASPMMEKRLAQKAGLGWQGKNSILVTKKYGSFVFLSTMITNIGLVFDKPETDYCKTCDRCVNECPTGAIVDHYKINVEKCISYWTTIFRGTEIPIELKNKFNGWVYGCDTCQDVCPYNKDLAVTKDQSFIPILEPNLDLLKYNNISEEEFNKVFCETPIMQIKRKKKKKNIRFLIE
jgi:epoxyqueuosine reductase